MTLGFTTGPQSQVFELPQSTETRPVQSRPPVALPAIPNTPGLPPSSAKPFDLMQFLNDNQTAVLTVSGVLIAWVVLRGGR